VRALGTAFHDNVAVLLSDRNLSQTGGPQSLWRMINHRL
jgi:hypothetical protein